MLLFVRAFYHSRNKSEQLGMWLHQRLIVTSMLSKLICWDLINHTECQNLNESCVRALPSWIGSYPGKGAEGSCHALISLLREECDSSLNLEHFSLGFSCVTKKNSFMISSLTAIEYIAIVAAIKTLKFLHLSEIISQMILLVSTLYFHYYVNESAIRHWCAQHLVILLALKTWCSSLFLMFSVLF